MSVKTIGMLGGMSWESTETYYRLINEGIRERLGGFHSAKVVLYSVDFYELEKMLASGDWTAIGSVLGGAARKIEQGGADCLVICTNTMHNVASTIEEEIGIPLFDTTTLHAAAAVEFALAE